jgi:hypothetical protein
MERHKLPPVKAKHGVPPLTDTVGPTRTKVCKRPWGGGRPPLLSRAHGSGRGGVHGRRVGGAASPIFSVFGWANEQAPRRTLKNLNGGHAVGSGLCLASLFFNAKTRASGLGENIERLA